MRDDIAMTTGNSQDSGSSDITDLGNDVYQIDTRMAGYQGITAGYLIRSSRPWAADLATVLVTHIHLDHAGGVGDIASMFAGAQVVVHEKGARHHVGLVDSQSGDLYVGDAAGVYIPETGDLRPATPPPDFDLSVALASLDRFASLDPSRSCSATTGR